MFAFNKAINTQISISTLEYMVETYICPSFVTNSTECHGWVTYLGDIIIHSLSKTILNPYYACEEVIPACPSKFVFETAEEYSNQIISGKPNTLESNSYVDDLYDYMIKTRKKRWSIKAVLLSDVHIDYKYTVGSDSQCNMEVCCRAENGFPTDPKSQA